MKLLSTIKFKLVFLIGAFIVVIITALSYYFYRSYSKLLREEVQKRGQELARNLSYAGREGVWNKNLFMGLEPLILASMTSPDVKYIAIVDETGRVLAHSDPKEKGKVYRDKLTQKVFLSNAPVFDETRDNFIFGNIVEVEEKKEGLFSASDINKKRAGGAVFIGLSLNNLHDEMNTILELTLVAAIILIITGIIFAFVFSAKITRPLLKLTEATLNIGSGDLEKRVRIETKDEVGELAGSFNKMTENLQRITVSRDELIKEFNEHKKEEETRKEIEHSFKSFVDNTPIGVYRTTTDWELYYVNDTMAKMFEFTSPEEFIATGGVGKYKDPAVTRAMIRDALQKEGRFTNLAAEMISKSGRVINVLISGIMEKDKYFSGTAIDITDFKHLQEKEHEIAEKYTNIVSVLPDILYALDTNAKMFDWNAETEKVSGYSNSEIRNMHALDFFIADDRKAIMEGITRAFKEGRAVAEGRLLTKDGKVIPYTWTAAIFKDIKGKVLGITGIGRDISERKKAEEELTRYKNHLEQLVATRTQELEAVNRELETFVSIAAHDLKEPLRSMQLFSQFLLEDSSDKLDETGKDYLRRINVGGDRARRLIDDLLVLSRLSRIKNPYVLADSKKMIKEALDRLESVIEQRKAKIELPGKLPLIFCDEIKMKELFYNLISNGIKYNDEPVPEIIIQAEEKQDEIKFSVRDNGIGIKKEYHEIIFRMFKRLHSKEEYGGGTGAGLAIVKTIVKEHGGRIWVESEKGKGSIFFFTLPKTVK